MTTTRERIARAVDDEGWQILRRSLKGKPTQEKIDALRRYWCANALDQAQSKEPTNDWTDIEIRIDNYIKALCRGGQLYPGETILTMIEQSWKPRIKK